MPRIGHHRRVTANHTWHVDWAERSLFVKANPNPSKAKREIAGHARLRPRYPVPALLATRRIGRWTVLAYARWPHRAVCMACPVRPDCLEHSMRVAEPAGMWGGVDEEERRELLRNARRPARSR